MAVNTVPHAHRPIRPKRVITFRRLKSIDTEAFRSDLLSLPLINDPAGDFDRLLTQYNTGLVCVLEKHAPFARKMERRWRSRGLVIDKECLLSSRDHMKQLISAEKVRFLNSKIADCRRRKSLFKIVYTFLLKKPGHKLPHPVPLDELVKRFGKFFVQKIENIRAGLEAAGPPPDSANIVSSDLHTFCDVSEEAYAAVVYIRIIYADGRMVIRHVKASNKSAPKKTIPIPRLEFNVAILGAR
jgi:hypothetical protein